jgi:hypothetical protein
MRFPPEVVDAVLSHMNDDHADDSLTIVNAFAEPGATAATMTGLDAEGGEWEATVGDRTVTVRVPWIERATDRAGLRREVVRLYDAALERLGLPPREGH